MVMAKKPASPPKPKRSLQPLAGVAAACSLAAGLYFAIVWLGEQAGEAVADRPRYRVKFDELACPAPPGMDRATFLAEVRYLARPPAEFSIMDEKALRQVAASFTRHPWVASAEPVSDRPAWPEPIRINLRKPRLAVAVQGGEWPARVVDELGVLLPSNASREGLAVFITPQSPPAAQPGEPWINPLVRRAVDLAMDYNAATIEKTENGWRITERGGRVLVLER